MLEIRKYPDPILRRRARAIRRVDDAVRTLARDMIETMQQAGGAGLAANQVGVLRRLIVLQLPEEDPRVLVNPAITAREGSRQVEEGCLSVPGYTGLLERAVRVKARALDEWGGKLHLTAEELLAQVIEHEVDHLDGILFLDHLKSHEDLHATGVGDGVHMHDVSYRVEADHSDRPGERAPVEHPVSSATLSRLDPGGPLFDCAFDLSDRSRPDVARWAGSERLGGVPLERRREPAGEDDDTRAERPGRGGDG